MGIGGLGPTDIEVKRRTQERSTRLTGLRRLSGRAGTPPLPSWIIGIVLLAIIVLLGLVAFGAVDPPAT